MCYRPGRSSYPNDVVCCSDAQFTLSLSVNRGPGGAGRRANLASFNSPLAHVEVVNRTTGIALTERPARETWPAVSSFLTGSALALQSDRALVAALSVLAARDRVFGPGRSTVLGRLPPGREGDAVQDRTAVLFVGGSLPAVRRSRIVSRSGLARGCRIRSSSGSSTRVLQGSSSPRVSYQSLRIRTLSPM